VENFAVGSVSSVVSPDLQVIWSRQAEPLTLLFHRCLLSLFTLQFNLEALAKVWDYIFEKGYYATYCIFIAMVKSRKDYLYKASMPKKPNVGASWAMLRDDFAKDTVDSVAAIITV